MKKLYTYLQRFILVGIALAFVLPILLTVTGSLMNHNEFIRTYGTLTIRFPPVVPRQASLSQYYSLLFNSFGFLTSYWNSIFLAIMICIFQLTTALPVSFGLAKLHLKANSLILFLYSSMMMMPFQVTMLPMYQLTKQLGIYNSQFSLIIPEIFSPFIVFLLTQFIKKVPDELIDAMNIDSSSSFSMFHHLIIPVCKPGLIAAVVLSFVETWNMVEKPLLYLSDSQVYPLSMLLHQAGKQVSPTTLAGCVLYIVPISLLWFCFKSDICDGMLQLQVK